jgi:hypothetical protein
MTPIEWGAVLVAASITFYFLGIFSTIRSIGIFIGIMLLGINGHIIGLAARVLEFAQNFLGTIVTWAFGAAVPGLLAIVLAIILINDWHPKNKAGKRTFWLAAGLAILIVAGATNIAALNNLPAGVQQGISQTTNGLGH